MNTEKRLLKVFGAVFDGEFDPSSINRGSDLRSDIGMNSIGMLYTAMAVEEEFGIKFTNDDFMNIRTVGDVISCIEEKSR